MSDIHFRNFQFFMEFGEFASIYSQLPMNLHRKDLRFTKRRFLGLTQD
jgi:hypothetical protein